MCCSNAAWKREEVPDHKFDFIDVHEFHATGWGVRLQYAWLYILVGKSIAVYIADVYTAVALLASNRWSGSILQASANNSKSGSNSAILEVPFNIGKWIFTGCIIFSFLLLLWETRKARAIIKSRDISYAFTNVMSQNWYSLRSFDHFCFFCQINNSKKKKDEASFFVFFTFKGWMSLLVADGPRQAINAITLYSFGKAENWVTNPSVYFGGSILKAGIIITMLFTLVIWVGSALLLLTAAIVYVPLLCYIQGNLKEYCCHKVDKRISELMKRKTRKRLAKEAELARKEAKTGKFSLPQPTLPQIGLQDEDLYAPSYAGSGVGSMRKGGSRKGPGSNYQYPPNGSSSGMSSYGGSSAGWDNRSYGGGMPSSNLSRAAYPYATSDHEELHRTGYAESVSSLDGLAKGAGAMGYNEGYGGGYMGGSESYPHQRQGGGGGYADNRAPSYHSEDEKLGGYQDEFSIDGRGASGGIEYHQQPPFNPNHMYSQPQVQRSQSNAFSTQSRSGSVGGREDAYYQQPPPLPQQSQQHHHQQSSNRNLSVSSLGYGAGSTVGGWEEGEGRSEMAYYGGGGGDGAGRGR